MPEGFGQLANLKDLNLRYCEKLASLPESECHPDSQLDCMLHFIPKINFGLTVPPSAARRPPPMMRQLLKGLCKQGRSAAQLEAVATRQRQQTIHELFPNMWGNPDG